MREGFGVNGLDKAVLLPSKALKYIINAVELKLDGQAPAQCLVCSVTQQTVPKY